MDQKQILIIIIGMAVFTFLLRVLPLLALSGKKLPDLVVRWLSYVPAAVLAAMLLPAILLVDGQIHLGIDNLFFWAALPSFAAAILTKNLFTPVIVGMVIVVLGRLLI